MPNYSNKFGTNFPTTIIDAGKHKDITDEIIGTVNLYRGYVNNGDMENARLVLESHPNLQDYIINMLTINKIEEEIYNTGVFAVNNCGKYTYIVSKETIDSDIVDDGTYWIQEY